MAYQKTQWKDHIEGVQTGTPVNAVNMNKIEEGIAAALPASAISSGSDVNGSAWIDLPGGVQICTGAMRWENIGVTTAISSGYVSQKLKFPNYAREFSAPPRCVISLAVSTDLGVALQADDEGPRMTMPQIFRLRAPTSTTVSSVTVHYIAIGLSS